ncbi:MAG: OmpH family outer membrane protein [Bdellovibrionales bacterium]
MRIILLFLAVLALLVSPFGVRAYAQTSIAVVDVDRLLKDADAAVALQKKRNAEREKLLSELSKKEQALRDKSKSFIEKRADMEEDERLKEQKAYETELLDARRLTEEHKRAFEIASNKSLLQLQDLVTQIVTDIAKEKGYNLVISSRNVVSGSGDLDITEETLKRMNAKKIDIPFKVEQ